MNLITNHHTFHRLLMLASVLVLFVLLSGSETWGQGEKKDDEKKDGGAKSSQEALNVYNDAASFQNNGALELAVQEWKKFVTKYGDDPRLIDAKYNLGVCYLQQQDFESSVKLLTDVVAGKKDFQRREDAVLNLGWSLYKLGMKGRPKDLMSANVVFAQLVEEFPAGKYRDQAYFFQGESYYMQGKRADAARAYQSLVDQFKDSDMRADGMYALGVTYEELSNFAQAGKVYDLFLQEFSKHELANEVAMRKAETVLRAGDFADAEKRFAKIAEVEGFESADHALYRCAFCVAQLERYKAAGDLFAKLTDQFPESRYFDQATMAAGRAYYRGNQSELAAKWFDLVLEGNNPFLGEAAHWRARLYVDAKQPNEALAVVDKHLKQAEGGPFYVNLLMDRADAMYELPERRQEAFNLYVSIAGSAGDHDVGPQALYNASFAAMEMKDPDKGLELAQQFLDKYKKHRLAPDVKHVAAECQLQLGNNSSAAKLFAEVSTESNLKSNAIDVRRALALYLENKYQDAIDVLLEKLPNITDASEKAEALYVIGISQLGKGEFANAEQSLKESLKVMPSFPQADEVLLNLSLAQRKQQRLDDAIATAEKVVTDYRTSPIIDQVRFRLAEYQYANENYNAAIEWYAKVIQGTKPNLIPFSLYGQGWSHLRTGDHAGAITSFTSLIDDHSEHKFAGPALYARAMAFQQSGEFKNGIADLKRFNELDRTEREKSDSLYLQGLCQVGLKQYAAAISAFQSILKNDSEYVDTDKVVYELAWAYKNSKKDTQAGDLFNHLAERHPTSRLASEANYHVGERFYQKGEYKKAIQPYLKSRSSGGDNDHLKEKATYKLGWSHFQLGDYENAIVEFKNQTDSFPNSDMTTDAIFMHGESYFKLQKYAEAFVLFKSVREKKTSSEQMRVLALLHGGQSAAQLKNWDESIEWMEEIRSKHPTSPYLATALYELGWGYQNNENLDKSIELYRAATEKSRGEVGARARFMIGEVFYAQRQFAKAILEFQQVMYGFGAEKSPPAVKPWQAKAGFEAGQCAGVLASQQRNISARRKRIDEAKKYFTFVVKSHPESKEATAAGEQLKKYSKL